LRTNPPVDSLKVELALVDADDSVVVELVEIEVSAVVVAEPAVDDVIMVVMLEELVVSVSVVEVVPPSSPLTCIGGIRANKQTESRRRVIQDLRITNRLRP